MKAQDQSAERVAFEKWAKSEGAYLYGENSELVRFAWYGWQARAALSAREAPAPWPQGNRWAYAIDEARISHCLDCTTEHDDPIASLSELMRVAEDMALDPAISERADALRKAAPAREGWQLVPKVASVDMCRAATEERHDHLYSPSMTVDESAQRVWKKMLAASPQAPTTDPAPPAAKAVEMDAVDAKRYRWWREYAMQTDDVSADDVFLDCESPEEVDAVIDAALSKQGGNHG